MRAWCKTAGDRINAIVEAIVAALMLLLVLDVWLGVADRYYFHWQLPWPEELARYLMIWAAMLAVSCGISRREHIGLTLLVGAIPEGARRVILIAMDLVALALFLYVFWFGIGFAQSGATRQAMIFGTSLQPYYAAIPVSAGIAAIQILLTMIRDMGDYFEPSFEEEAE
ncbi:TRAP transporter small permease [Paracoccus sp. SCSIO 75233]|uniref:TRAP transporter small permease n=1 Tax=Paracoccus sp. SCSIO 75233 TaxID=3017782 RepID=UPI0022F033E7|nr:TRAP transporter small permease [Paracoccus sp. SCSIO 75233]WBU55206.1 TRAP transporter small permease [Paracoccus sp. SCSIO 75233]